MKPHDRSLALRISAELRAYDRGVRRLPGIADDQRHAVFIEQVIDSIHRVRYPSLVRERGISLRRADPNDEMFDPVKAAVLHHREGDEDEAFWCVFLFVHFGRHSRGGYRYAREVYGRLGDGGRWDWASTSGDPTAFRAWLRDHEDQIRRSGVPGGFGNHRKYQSLSAHSSSGTGAAVESYVRWVGPPRTHDAMVGEVLDQAAFDARAAFDLLYQSMTSVISFGRMARFDYLTMLGKLGLAPIEPGSAYLDGSTGPLKGAHLLFGTEQTHQVPRATVDQWLLELGDALGVGMQVMEDALCNWQKSPARYVPFRG